MQENTPLLNPDSIKGKIQAKVQSKVAEVAAHTVAKPSNAAKQMSQKMPIEMEWKMLSKGITAEAVCKYIDGPFFVMQLTIKRV